jgi:dCMP deaminase
MTWDKYFFKVAHVIKENSKCFSRQVGAILVRNKLIFSTGYNGPPDGFPTCDKRKICIKDKILDLSNNPEECPRQVMGFKSGKGLDYCVAAHAEENCILNAGVLGVSTVDSVMYMTCGIPCKNCLIKIIRAKISTCVCTSFDIYDETSKEIIRNSGIHFRLYDFLEKQERNN